jgi:PAS domain S-box-containing protein
MGSVLTFSLAANILRGLEENPASNSSVRICGEQDSVAELVQDLNLRRQDLEVVVIGAAFVEPIQLAQRIHALDKTVSVLILASREDLPRLQKAVQFSLFIGNQVVCLADDDLDKVLREVATAIARTRSRRNHSHVLERLNQGMAKARQSPDALPVHLDKLLDYAPIAVTILTADSNIVAWNRRASEIVGLPEREVLAQPVDALFESRSNKTFQQTLLDVSQGNGTITLEATRFVDGVLKTFEFTVGRLPVTSGQTLMLIFYDITDRKLAQEAVLKAKQQAEAANESKSRFLANMSHEIRTPIGAILGFLDLMRQPSATPSDIQDFIATIDRNGHQLLRLIDDILDISKIEAGRVTIEKSMFSFVELLADIQSLMGFRAREKGLVFRIELENTFPEYVEGDAIRLRQVLTNIVGNAIKFTEAGSVQMTVAYGNDSCRILVEDTGIGLTNEQAGLLFSPFMQADMSISRRFGGTGLGLALSQKLARLMGGDLRLLRSQLGSGSTFEVTIHLPAQPDVRYFDQSAIFQALPAPLKKAKSSGASLSSMRILIVEDSPDNQILISRYLISEGAKIEFANDGLEGIAKALGSKFNVVIMDMQMPRCDGLEATRRLRSEGYDRPIVALTAHAMEEERRKAFASGCTDYLTKPIDKSRLVNVLARYQDN